MNDCKNSNGRIQKGKTLCVWGFVAVMVAIAVGAEQGLTEPDPNPDIIAANVDLGSEEAAMVISESAQAVVEESATGAKIQSISFKKDWGIRDALQFLAARYQKNIVPSAQVDGLVTVTNLYDVTFTEALDAILGYGFKYEQQGNFIKVYTADEYKKIKEDPERRVYKVFTLYYISAAEAKKLITPVVSKNGSIETTAAAVTEFPTGESISSVSGGGDATAVNDTIIVYDYPESLEKVADVLRWVDVRPIQVLIEATVLSVTLTEDTQFGIDWQTLLGNASGGTSFIGSTKDFFKSQGTSQVTKSGGLHIGFSHDSIASVIKAVEVVSDVTILANPKILAVNKQLGQVYIGKKLGYESQTTQTETSTTQRVEFLDTGTKLSFRPYIGNDGYIRMDIHPKDSSGDLKANNIPEADQLKREEVVILLTPHIIEQPAETEGEARADDVSRKRFGAKDAMQQIGRARLAEDSYASAVRYYLQGDSESALWQLSIALKLRPTYIEALRLKERIIAETDPEDGGKLERVMLEVIDRQEASKWLRR